MSEQKAVIVYGTGISGVGAAEVLAGHNRQVFLYNDNECSVEKDLLELLTRSGGRLVCGGFADILPLAEIVVLSPGIPAENANVQLAQQAGVEVISEIELAYRLYGGHIAAITGTNGKTTTTTLVGEMLKKLPVTTAVGGNIGLALSKETEGLTAESWIAAELSSFQLEFVRDFCPDIAVVLNLTPDHMERHHTMEAYGAAKKNIFLQQTGEQVAVLNYDDMEVRSWGKEARGRVCYFSRKNELNEGVYIKDGVFTISWQGKKYAVCRVDGVHLFGGHNEENILAAVACGFFAGVAIEDMAEVLKNFKSIEHRLEYVATINGVPYYNDSKATNTDSAIKALEAFPNGHIILLAGGHDKMTELKTMMGVVKEKTDLLILLGEAKERFYQAAKDCGVQNIQLADSFEDAVQKAYEAAHEPQTVLLSPACSSYDMFKNYPERGRCFKQLVRALIK